MLLVWLRMWHWVSVELQLKVVWIFVLQLWSIADGHPTSSPIPTAHWETLLVNPLTVFYFSFVFSIASFSVSIFYLVPIGGWSCVLRFYFWSLNVFIYTTPSSDLSISPSLRAGSKVCSGSVYKSFDCSVLTPIIEYLWSTKDLFECLSQK